ncbi:MAG: hypothetical protein ABI607_07100 [Betaproteobacteria bacterium]
MIHFARGSQRRVIVWGQYALKLPRLRRLRAGARANLEEARIWREGWQRRFPELCPVVACLPFGTALVMPAVRIMTQPEFNRFKASGEKPDHYPDPELYEDKLGEWGYLNGCPVVVDYAMRVHMTSEDLELIDPRVRTIRDVMCE